MVLMCMPVTPAYASGISFDVDTLTISGLGDDWSMFFSVPDDDDYSHPNITGTTDFYTFTDKEYDKVTDTEAESGTPIVVEVDKYDGFPTKLHIFPRFPEPAITVISSGIISGLFTDRVYQYSFKNPNDGAEWIDFTSADRTYSFSVDENVETTIWIRCKADNRRPVSYPVRVDFEALEEPDEDDELTFKFNAGTMTFTGLQGGWRIYATSPNTGRRIDHTTTVGTIGQVFVIDNYDSLFNNDGKDRSVFLRIQSPTNPDLFGIELLPRTETPNEFDFDEDVWTVSSLTSLGIYQYANPEMQADNVWGSIKADKDGEAKINLTDRSRNYKASLRVGASIAERNPVDGNETILEGTDVIYLDPTDNNAFININGINRYRYSAVPPSHSADLEVTRYELFNHILTVDMDDELIVFSKAFSQFGADTQFEWMSSDDPNKKWKRVALREDEARLRTFIPKTRKHTVYFRVRGQTEWFDFITINPRPMLEGRSRDARVMLTYLHKNPDPDEASDWDIAMLKNWTRLMQISNRPGRDDDYDWSDIGQLKYNWPELDWKTDADLKKLGLEDRIEDPGIAIIELPDRDDREEQRKVIRIAPADWNENLIHGKLDEITPASRMKGLRLLPPAKAPRTKIRERDNTLSVRPGMEYWVDSGEVQKVEKVKGAKARTIDVSEYDLTKQTIYIRTSATERRPATEVQTLPDTTAPRLKLSSKTTKPRDEFGDPIITVTKSLTIKRGKGFEYRIGDGNWIPVVVYKDERGKNVTAALRLVLSVTETTSAGEITAEYLGEDGTLNVNNNSRTVVEIRCAETGSKPASKIQRFIVGQ